MPLNMQPSIFDRDSIRNAEIAPRRRRHSRHSEADDIAEWLSSESPATMLDPNRREGQFEATSLGTTGASSGPGLQFFQEVSQRLTAMRLQTCTLARAQSVPEKVASLTSLSSLSRWLAGYSQQADFHALSQVASALHDLTEELVENVERLTETVIRSLAHAVDLLNTLASTTPAKAGRSEGARVVVVDQDAQSRGTRVANLEAFSVSAVGVHSEEPVLALLAKNKLDLIVLRAEDDVRDAAQLCQTVRRLPAHAKTPILVLSSKAAWENWAVLAISGATEVVQGEVLRPELALKVLGHFFRTRLGCNRASDRDSSIAR